MFHYFNFTYMGAPLKRRRSPNKYLDLETYTILTRAIHYGLGKGDVGFCREGKLWEGKCMGKLEKIRAVLVFCCVGFFFDTPWY